MKLYLISQTERDGYDTYDSAIVCAESANDAAAIHPEGQAAWEDKNWHAWARTPDNVKAEYIGEAATGIEKGIILASFNAG